MVPGAFSLNAGQLLMILWVSGLGMRSPAINRETFTPAKRKLTVRHIRQMLRRTA